MTALAAAVAPGALEGIRVLDLSGASGQYAGKLFAGLGADVLLIEPLDGSPVRRDAPFLDHQPGIDNSLPFQYFNTGKRGLAIDLDRSEGQQLLRRLAAQADLLIESAKPGVMARRGLDATALHQLAPRLTVTSITPFGQSGPYAQYDSEDIVVLALSGMLSLGGYPDVAPTAAYGNQATLAGSLFAAVASMMALWAVEGDASARGQHIDVSLQQCAAMGLENAVQFVDLENTVRKRDAGQQRQAGNGVFDCADGQVYLMAGGIASNRFWAASTQWLIDEGVGAAEAFKAPQWNDQTYLLTEEAKQRFGAAFNPFARSRTKAQLYLAAQSRRIPLCPIATPADLLQNRQLASRNYFVDVLHSASGRLLTMPGAPYRLSETPWQVQRPAPRLGEHTDEILRGLGLDMPAVQALRAQGVVA